MPGTVAGSQPLVSMPGPDIRPRPLRGGPVSSVRSQPDSTGTVSSAPARSGGDGSRRVGQLVQPVAGGRRAWLWPYTEKPLSPSGLPLDRLVAVMRIQRAVTGAGSVIVMMPPVPAVVSYTLVHV